MRIQEWSQFPAYGREDLCNELYIHISFKYFIHTHTHMCILRLVCNNWRNEAKGWHDLNKKQEEVWGWNWITSGNSTGKPEIDAKHWSADGKVGWSDGRALIWTYRMFLWMERGSSKDSGGVRLKNSGEKRDEIDWRNAHLMIRPLKRTRRLFPLCYSHYYIQISV